MAFNFPIPTFVGQVHAFGPGLPSYQWNGVGWISIGSAMAVDTFAYTATGGETSVPVPGGYLANMGIAIRGGAVQAPADDVDISSGTNIVFATALTAGESILFYKFRAFSLIDALTKSQNLADLTDKAAARANLGVEAARTRLSARLAAVGTFLPEISGLEADTLYRGEFLAIANADGGIGWDSRFVSGGAWDSAADDYANQHGVAFGSNNVGSAQITSYAVMNTIDGSNPGIVGLAQFTLYTGTPTRRATMVGTFGGITSDGGNLITMAMQTQRVDFGAITDIRFRSGTTNGLAAGSRAFLEKLG